ncbi:hypothetical protein LTS17_002598 [Exophiala oligosperma]
MAFSRSLLLILLLGLVLFTCRAHAFGAGSTFCHDISLSRTYPKKGRSLKLISETDIASISAVEGKNWRHGDIEDVLKTVACIKHHKWNSMMIKHYSQAMDTGALKKAQPETIRILVWLLSFLGFGYATAEFEVTSERLGVYRPEEHIDNPKDYNDNEDARQYDKRLRGPVRDIELQIDMETGMKNYIANGKGDWATSAAYVKYSFEQSIHHGRLYTNGRGIFKGKDEELAEALRCLGQGLHTLEDFGAHTNYVELALRELGFHNVFPHVGTSTGINLHGKHVFPLVTGTFGMVDFYHSVLGEATDHFTQSEVNEMDNALGTAQQAAKSSNPLFTLVKLLSKVPGTKELCDEAEQLQASSQAQARANEQAFGEGQPGYRGVDDFGNSTRGLDDWGTSRASHAGFPGQQGYDNNWNASQQGYQQPQQNWGQSQHQQWTDPSQQNFNAHDQYPGGQHNWQQPQQAPQQSWGQHQQPQQWDQPAQGQQGQQGQQWNQPQEQHTQQATPAQASQQQPSAQGGLPGMPNFDPAKTIAQIYPILAFRDKVVRAISAIIEKIPGLEALVERITETLTVFILSLLAPFVRPVINAISKSLQTGSEGVINSSGKHQYEVWTNPHSSDPTHSMLSKDHFSNLLNEPAGNVAAEIVKFIAPRVLYAWENPNVPIEQVMRDVETVFHHPAIRNERNEVHRNMFAAVKNWVDGMPDRGRSLEGVLNSEAVRAGKNHKAGVNPHLQSSHTPQHQQQQQHSHGGGLGGLASSFLPGHNQQHGGGGGGGGGSSNPLGMVGNVLGSFSGQGGHQQQQGGHSGSGGGGLGGVLSLASKMNVPGASNVQKYGKLFGSFGGGGGKREIGPDGGGADDDDTGADQYRAFRSEAGGASDLYEAAANATHYGGGNVRTPSPMPQVPAGYEQYSGQGQGEGAGFGYGQEQQQGYQQYQTNYQQPHEYGGGGESQGYYYGR